MSHLPARPDSRSADARRAFVPPRGCRWIRGVAGPAFQFLPVLIDGPILNHSRWEGVMEMGFIRCGPWSKSSGYRRTAGPWPVTGTVVVGATGRRLIRWSFYRRAPCRRRRASVRRRTPAAGFLWTADVGSAASAAGRDAGSALAPHHRGRSRSFWFCWRRSGCSPP